MSELLDAMERHLGVRVLEGSLNHYSMLGLKVNAGPNEIKQALRTAIAAWNASDTKSDPTSAQSVAKLIKQAQAVLLDRSKKLEYDKQLDCHALPINHSFLPTGDPFAPFDPSECFEGAGTRSVVCSFGSVNERWNELSRQFPALTQSAVVQVGESAAATIERLKRKRSMTQRIYVAGFLAFAAVFLGYAGIRFVWNRQQIAQKLGANSITKVQTKKLAETAPDSVLVLPSLDKTDSSTNPIVEFTESNPFGTAPMALSPSQQIQPDAIPSEPQQSPSSQSGSVVSDTQKPIPIKPIEEKSMVPIQPRASKSEWIDAMTKARDAVDKADFPTFHKYMKMALSLSTNDEMVLKQARLDQLGQLYEIFISSIQEAKSKLDGVETISVGKLQVNIVEIREDQLIVRIQGKNERFAWDRLPPGIAMALADLTLSDQEPTDIAARAVYCSLSPARHQLFAKRVKDWFEKSVGKGTIRKDLVQALTDTYE